MDSYERKRKQHGDKSVNVDILTGTAAYADVIAPRSANHTVYIQRIILSITTHVADTYTFDDDGAGPAIATHLDVTPQAAGVPSTVTWDFGPNGRPITGKLDVSHSSTGVAIARIEAYERLSATINTGTANTAN